MTETAVKDDDGQLEAFSREPDDNDTENKSNNGEKDGADLNKKETDNEISEEEIDVQADAEMIDPDIPADTEMKPNGPQGSVKNE